MSTATSQELEELRQDLANVSGKEYWERLESYAESGAFRSFMEREYPSRLECLADPVRRRDFLRLMGASLAMAGLGSCTRQPEERILPYARNPETTVPGKPRFFATAMPLDGVALGLVVESHMGRPTKVEGNALHPASLGATDGFAQAATLGLYDPDRSHSVLAAGQISTWPAFHEALRPQLERLESDQGEGLRLLLGDSSSPTLEAQLEVLLARYPRARVHRWTPLHADEARAGGELAFGSEVVARPRFDRATVVVALDADFLMSGPGGVRNARDWAASRRIRHGEGEMSRLFAVETGSTLTGANADERLAVRPSELEGVARALASALGVDVEARELSPEQGAFVELAARRLREQRGKGLLVAGEGANATVHALVHAMNDILENAGETVDYVAAPQAGSTASLRELVDDLRRESVRVLVMLGGNPVYDAPADLDFAAALRSAEFRVHLSVFEDETSELCHWHLPESHFLESWSDARAHDGTLGVVQPLIAPLYDGRGALEIVAALLGKPGRTAYEIVRENWRARLSALGEGAFEAAWDTALHDGLLRDSAAPPLPVRLRRIAFGPAPPAGAGLEVVFRRDASVHDGRFANNGWLQELPRPLTRLVWDNAALIAESTARALGVEDGDVVEFTAGEHGVRAPVWILPGHAPDVVTMHLGYGRRRAGRLGSGRGFDAYRLRTAAAPWSVAGVEARPTGERVELVSVQDHGSMEGRDIVRVAEFDRFRRDPHHTFGHGGHDPADLSMYPDHQYPGYSWGMVIDLTACIGCNACMVACQSENNVPIVGKDEVARGRELHWLRVDRYFETDEQGRQHVHHQPVPCMHCENAPCEVVCPVGATVHGNEGLNEMVYNRCVGTRYCSNNCPYKVRRFNFFHYADYETESLKLGNNPDVTVRSRGVMEKCTYCVQRINESRIQAKVEDRSIRDGEVQPACQQACPTQAIAFGDINDEESHVTELKNEPHNYGLLAELGTRPRTTYLAKLVNPDPEGAR